MGIIRWLTGFCIAVVIAAFAAFNRAEVTVVWSPFHPPQDQPLFLPVTAFMILGFLLGVGSVWLNTLKAGQEKRLLKKRIKTLEKRMQDAQGLQTSPALPDLGEKR